MGLSISLFYSAAARFLRSHLLYRVNSDFFEVNFFVPTKFDACQSDALVKNLQTIVSICLGVKKKKIVFVFERVQKKKTETT